MLPEGRDEEDAQAPDGTDGHSSWAKAAPRPNLATRFKSWHTPPVRILEVLHSRTSSRSAKNEVKVLEPCECNTHANAFLSGDLLWQEQPEAALGWRYNPPASC